jgi:hypothetical protein
VLFERDTGQNKAAPRWFIATWTAPSAPLPSTDSHET